MDLDGVPELRLPETICVIPQISCFENLVAFSNCHTAHRAKISNPNPSDLVGRELFASAIVELGGPRRLMIGDGLGVLEGPAVFEISGDADGTKRVAAGQGGGLG